MAVYVLFFPHKDVVFRVPSHLACAPYYMRVHRGCVKKEWLLKNSTVSTLIAIDVSIFVSYIWNS
jgi:hypothetical protein